MPPPRKSMTFRRSHLRSTEAADARVAGTISDRLALVPALSLAAWANGKKPLPGYDRSQIPVRIIRRGSIDVRD
jgi:hypothetical protein